MQHTPIAQDRLSRYRYIRLVFLAGLTLIVMGGAMWPLTHAVFSVIVPVLIGLLALTFSLSFVMIQTVMAERAHPSGGIGPEDPTTPADIVEILLYLIFFPRPS